MAAESPNWDSKLCIMFKSADGSSTVISPITSIENTIETPSDIIDSVDGENLGRSYGNRRYTFNFEVPALNFAVYRGIYNCALNRILFDVVMATLEGQNDSWFVDSIEFTNCAITSTVESVDNTGKAPTLKFQANCLGISTSNNGQNIITNKTGTASGSLS